MRGSYYTNKEGIMRDFDRAVRALDITVVQINVSVPGQPRKMVLVDLRDDNA